MNIIYSALAILSLFFSPSLQASVYLNEAAAKEGATRGATEEFTKSVGYIRFDIENNEDFQANGVLIHPQLILTNRHVAKKMQNYQGEGSFLTASDVGAFVVGMSSPSTSHTRKIELTTLGARLDLTRIYLPDDEDMDLAIVGLKKPQRFPLPLSS